MAVEDTRIYKLRQYMFTVLDNLLSNNKYQINADFLDNDIENYSIDKVPVESVIESWITGDIYRRDVYEFRSRKAYSQDVLNNLSNIGFFEVLEKTIKQNNDNKVLPDIEGIQEIKCLNCGALNFADTNTAEFSIQIQIQYKEV